VNWRCCYFISEIFIDLGVGGKMTFGLYGRANPLDVEFLFKSIVYGYLNILARLEFHDLKISNF